MDLYRVKYSDKKSDRKFKSNKKSSDRNSRNEKPYDSFRNSRSSSFRSQDREMFSAVCSDCGNECKLPFEPKFNKPVYCSECFEKNEPRKSNRSNFDRDRPRSRNQEFQRPRYERDNRSRSRDYDFRKPRQDRDDYQSKKPKLSKLQKKQDSFYSNGSEKFYESLKEKLFEILGGKVCSSCGFKDQRALGFTHIFDDDVFDRIRRGGFASSWGKYISDPELAKKELRVLCLNCNEIREPIQKKESKEPKKKSRYFPR